MLSTDYLVSYFMGKIEALIRELPRAISFKPTIATSLSASVPLHLVLPAYGVNYLRQLLCLYSISTLLAQSRNTSGIISSLFYILNCSPPEIISLTYILVLLKGKSFPVFSSAFYLLLFIDLSKWQLHFSSRSSQKPCCHP